MAVSINARSSLPAFPAPPRNILNPIDLFLTIFSLLVLRFAKCEQKMRRIPHFCRETTAIYK
jgi:hypothetical protein